MGAVWAVAAVSVALLISACGSDGGSSGGDSSDLPAATSGDPLAPQPLKKRETIKISVGKVEAWAPLLLADALGEFDKENLSVEISYLPVNDSTLLVAQGELDAGGAAFSAGLLNLMDRSPELKFVFPGSAQLDDSTAGFWINSSKVGAKVADLTAQDLVDKKVLTPSGEGSQSGYRYYEYLKTLPGGDDISAKDLTFEAFDVGTTPQALISGAAAVGQVNSPLNQLMASNECCEYLKGAYPLEPPVGYVFGPSMDNKAAAGQAFIRTLARTTKTYLGPDYRTDDKVMNALAKILGVDRSNLDGVDPVFFDPEFKTGAEANLAAQPFFRERGLLTFKGKKTADDVWDFAYLESIGVDVAQ